MENAFSIIESEPSTEDGFIYEIETPSFGSTENSEDKIVLIKSDLIANSDNEIVIKNNSEHSIVLVSSEELSETAIVQADSANHKTAMKGYHFYSFADGITVYAETPIKIQKP